MSRTKLIKTKSASRVAPVVITYGGPASMRCGDNLNATRRVRYVESRDLGTRYVAVRRDDGRRYMVPQTRYVAVRNVERYEEPRYVAVRRSPAYVDAGTRYVAVRTAPVRTKYVAVRNIDIDDVDNTRYVAVRRSAAYDDGARYVAVRNADSGYRRVVVNDDLDMIEAPAPRHVVVRTDYIDGTQEVIVPNANRYADAEYAAYPTANTIRTNYVSYADGGEYVSGERYVVTRDMDNMCARQVAMRSCPGSINTSTVSYVPVSGGDYYDDQAYLDEAGTTYVVADDVETACLKRSVHHATPVSYVPVEYADDDAYLSDDYIVEDRAVRSVRYVPAQNDDYDLIEADTVSYAPVNRVEYIDDSDYANVRYAPAETVSYVPAESVNDVEATYIAADDCMLMADGVADGTVYVADTPAVAVEVVDSGTVAGFRSAQRIAAGFGYRDGFEDGRDDADDNDAYNPEGEGDFRNGENGYEDEFGPKDVYRDAYREAYLQGYRAGYGSLSVTD